VKPTLIRASLVAAILTSAALAAGCASTDDEESTAAARKSETTEQQTAGEAVDDAVVTAKVKARLVDDPLTKAYQINVATIKGTVQLNGVVDSAEASSRAEQLAGAVGGVKDVENSLQVRKPEG
jgi:hyperosmotically inducible protein